MPLSPPEPAWRVIDRAAGKQALVIAGAGDDAEVWPLQYKQRESWSSWGRPARACPATPGSVPAVYDDNQSVQATDLVLWYIAHVSSADVIASCGPRFVLEGYPAPPVDEDDADDDHHDDEDGHHDGRRRRPSLLRDGRLALAWWKHTVRPTDGTPQSSSRKSR